MMETILYDKNNFKLMLRNLSRWLSGQFVCEKCGRVFHSMVFGFGIIICPDCYEDEKHFIFFDSGYWLNRLSSKLVNRSRTLAVWYDSTKIPAEPSTSEIEIKA